MTILLLVLLAVLLAVLALYLSKRLREMREQRMTENQYNTAVTLWNFAGFVKREIEEALASGQGLLNFTRIVVPHSVGYKMTLELVGTGFHLNAVPENYGRTGRLSFYVDHSTTVRAGDHQGQPATADDPEYTGEEAEPLPR